MRVRVRRVPRLHISQLWQVFCDKFCPQTQIELVHRSRSFQDLKQGTATIKQFTDKVLTEWDLLLFMGITKSEDEVKNTIMMGLTDSFFFYKNHNLRVTVQKQAKQTGARQITHSQR